MTPSPFQNASAWIDAENAQDPNTEIDQSQSHPKELLYCLQSTTYLSLENATRNLPNGSCGLSKMA